jgi:hypothetical protein
LCVWSFSVLMGEEEDIEEEGMGHRAPRGDVVHMHSCCVCVQMDLVGLTETVQVWVRGEGGMRGERAERAVKLMDSIANSYYTIDCLCLCIAISIVLSHSAIFLKNKICFLRIASVQCAAILFITIRKCNPILWLDKDSVQHMCHTSYTLYCVPATPHVRPIAARAPPPHRASCCE